MKKGWYGEQDHTGPFLMFVYQASIRLGSPYHNVTIYAEKKGGGIYEKVL